MIASGAMKASPQGGGTQFSSANIHTILYGLNRLLSLRIYAYTKTHTYKAVSEKGGLEFGGKQGRI